MRAQEPAGRSGSPESLRRHRQRRQWHRRRRRCRQRRRVRLLEHRHHRRDWCLGPVGDRPLHRLAECAQPKASRALHDQVLTDDVLKPFQVVVTLHAGIDGRARLHHGKDGDQTPRILRRRSSGLYQVGQSWRRSHGDDWVRAHGKDDAGNREEENVNKLFAPIGIILQTRRLPRRPLIRLDRCIPVTKGVMKIDATNGLECAGDGTVVAHDSSRCALRCR